MSAASSADRNLLFGILALQMNFVDKDALVLAMSAWVLAKDKPISQILLKQGKITAVQVRALDDLIALQLEAHKNDARRSLEALESVSALGRQLTEITDDDVQESLACLTTLSRDDVPMRQPATGSNGLRYKKEREHDRGGLGQVYVAEDMELHRKVALKEIRLHRADDPAARARFVLEAEITGGLEHPGIVPVYGFGTYADGRPYYAMRFIHGTSLREAIERFHDFDKPDRDPGERSLAFRQLLRRFVDACNAVAYAHNRGVLHRDLKPMNIMLGDFGETLVIDWGLAKAGVRSAKRMVADTEGTIDPTLRPSSSDLLMTNVGAAIGTPAFMSPEQAAGNQDLVNSASDIYGMGATLYILLTGKKPYEGESESDVMEHVKIGQFPPPRQVKPGTPPALDAICRKAMAFQPEDRYHTALDLAADIEHWLADEPVDAYPEPWPARAARWMRRHRSTVIGTVVFLACAVIGLSISTGLIWREKEKTNKQKELAQKNRDDAIALGSDLVKVVAGLETELAANPNTHQLRSRAFRDATNRAHSLRAADPDNRDLQLLTADFCRFSANVERLESNTGEAFGHYVECIQLYRELGANDGSQREKLAGALRDFASLQTNLGKHDGALAAEQEAIRILEAWMAEAPEPRLQRGLSRSLANALVGRGRIEQATGDSAACIQTALAAEERYAALAKGPPEESHGYDPVLRALALNIAAVGQRNLGQFILARDLHRRAIELLLRVKDKPRPGLNNNDVVFFLDRLGLEHCHTLETVGDQRGLVYRNLDDMISSAQELASAFPTIPMYGELLADIFLTRGRMEAEDSQFEKALADLDRAWVLHSVLLTRFPQIPGYRAELGSTQMELGKLALALGNQDAGNKWFAEALNSLGLAAAQAPRSAALQRTLKEAQLQGSKPK